MSVSGFPITKVTIQGNNTSTFINRALVRFYNNHEYQSYNIASMRFYFSDGTFKQFGDTGRKHASFEWGYTDKRNFDMAQLNDPEFPWDDPSHNFDYGADSYGYKTYNINMPNGFDEMRIGRFGDPQHRSYITNNNIGFYKAGDAIAEIINPTEKCCNVNAFPKDVYEAIDIDPTNPWTIIMKTPIGQVCGGIQIDDHTNESSGFTYHYRMFTGLIGVSHTNKPVDGEWGAWSIWSSCNKRCDSGESTRTRLCDNPPAAYGGADCLGDLVESKICNSWTCSPEDVHVGEAMQFKDPQTIVHSKTTREFKKYAGDRGNSYINKVKFAVEEHPRYTRANIQSIEFTFNDGSTRVLGITDPKNPKSVNYTGTLPKSDSQTITVHTFDMPNGFDEIRGGYKRASRYPGYFFMANIGFYREGKTLHEYIYSKGNCCNPPGLDYGDDDSWQAAKYQPSREFPWTITLKIPNGLVVSAIYEMVYDNTQTMDWLEKGHLFAQIEGVEYYPTPVHGGWSNWLPWGSCSKECGGGSKSRTRTCDNPFPSNDGNQCVGDAMEFDDCNTAPCPVHGGWSGWGAWGTCTKECGGGNQIRNRSCNNPTPQGDGKSCDGLASESQECNTDGCPVHGGWSAWGPWEECSQKCGGGKQLKRRSCNNPSPLHRGNQCVGNEVESRDCNDQGCPINGGVSEWSSWSECLADVDGVNTNTRKRTCTNPEPKFGGALCSDTMLESQGCDPDVPTIVTVATESQGSGMTYLLLLLALVAAAIIVARYSTAKSVGGSSSGFGVEKTGSSYVTYS
jgi:hypothetical protein